MKLKKNKMWGDEYFLELHNQLMTNPKAVILYFWYQIKPAKYNVKSYLC